ncbi:hypothetical protein JCM31826_20100 [Thermaurantimonas aggregans]|uniref:Glycosyltransferase RgtA/B/C/D-like domain-containing protein n=1 Tax=Thermaurantimonas aggregans TaxID=2173829 RepID=A0A401XND4_9FLAO|nr:glycosyltransferase family 39 protein [Thermaurantimonas aggregans]MCX8149645.1 glycosyltransferase family 39 protein [Thermaurantimonas aggregans]GCD78528.1 hypothetical protein JCM31826_20100 [Thermaurantimonas aggregans]
MTRWKFENTLWLFFYITVSLVYLRGLFLGIMDVDSAQYASISREMYETGNYLQVYHQGRDYLDKPPFLFWTSALGYRIFGVNEFGFRFFSFLFSILGVYSTYRLGRLLYNVWVGKVSALILATSQAWFLFNHDVRTDTILTGSATFAAWQLLYYLKGKKLWPFIGGFTGIAIAMMSKGPIGLVIPAIAVGTYLLSLGKWKKVFHWRWLVGLAWTLLLLLPMLYGLYTQYDALPEKEVELITSSGPQRYKGLSGIKFFFWTQSFGRITGESDWKDESSPFYFVHNFLWSFAPWSLLAFLALYSRLKNNLASDNRYKEWVSPVTFLAAFFAFSASRFKLPHYLFIAFPYAALFTAYFVVMRLPKLKGWVKTMAVVQQYVFALVSVVVAVLLMAVVFPEKEYTSVIIWLTGVVAIIISLLKLPYTRAILAAGAFTGVMFNGVLNFRFYPELMEYQPGYYLAKKIHQSHISPSEVCISFVRSIHALEFYSQHIFCKNADIDPDKSKFWICSSDQLKSIEAKKLKFQILYERPAFHITLLNAAFLNPATRESQLEKVYLIEIKDE